MATLPRRRLPTQDHRVRSQLRPAASNSPAPPLPLFPHCSSLLEKDPSMRPPSPPPSPRPSLRVPDELQMSKRVRSAPDTCLPFAKQASVGRVGGCVIDFWGLRAKCPASSNFPHPQLQPSSFGLCRGFGRLPRPGQNGPGKGSTANSIMYFEESAQKDPFGGHVRGSALPFTWVTNRFESLMRLWGHCQRDSCWSAS